MKNYPASSGTFFFLCSAVLFLLSSLNVRAEGFEKATVTAVKNQVLISKKGEKGRKVSVKEILTSNTEISTGKDSRAELVFVDQSIVRLGSNSTFSFNPKTREMNIQRGIVLIHVPPHQGGAKIITPTANAIIYGDVIAVRCLGKDGVTEFVHLSPKDEDGAMIVTCNHTGEKQELGGGQLLRVFPFEARLPKPVDISVSVFAHTSSLISQKVNQGAGIRQLSPSTASGSTSVNNSGSSSGSATTSGSTTGGGGTSDSTTTDTASSGGSSTSSGHDVTVDTGNTPVTGGTTVTADTPITSENSVNTTVDGSGVSTGGSDTISSSGTSDAAGHDITVSTDSSTPVAGDTTVTADTPVTDENFADLFVSAQSEITQEEIDQAQQIEGGVLEVSTEQTQENTTVAVSDSSGTTDANVTTSVDSSTTSAIVPDSTLDSNTTVSSDATVTSDVTLLTTTTTKTKSLITQITTDPTNTTSAIAEEEDVTTDVTAQTLCTPTDLLPCPNE